MAEIVLIRRFVIKIKAARGGKSYGHRIRH